MKYEQQQSDFWQRFKKSRQASLAANAFEGVFKSVINPTAGERALDVGCGEGDSLILLDKIGLNVTGLDSSVSMILKAKESFSSRYALKLGQAEDLPFEDNEFDIVTFINTIGFLDNPVESLREAGRVANRKVFIGFFNPLSPYGFINMFCGLTGNSFLRSSFSYNIYKVKRMITEAFGNVPMEWTSLVIFPNFLCYGSRKSYILQKNPFGSFIGVSATITYRYKTKNISVPLKIKKGYPAVEGMRTDILAPDSNDSPRIHPYVTEE